MKEKRKNQEKRVKTENQLKRYELRESKLREVDTTSIETGNTYRNYAALCAALKEEVKTSNSKASQVREWERYFSYHREGTKWIIDEVYEHPEKKTSRSTYGETVYKSLLYLACEGKKKYEDKYAVIEYSKGYLMVLVGLISQEFRGSIWNVFRDKKASRTKKEFFRETNTYLLKAFDRTLDTLVRNKGMTYKYDMMFVTDENHHVKATKRGIEEVYKAEREVNAAFGCINNYEAQREGVYSEYADMMNKEMKEIGIKHHYDVIKIFLPRDDVETFKRYKNSFGPEAFSDTASAFEEAIKNHFKKKTEESAVSDGATEKYREEIKKYIKKYITPTKHTFDKVYEIWRGTGYKEENQK